MTKKRNTAAERQRRKKGPKKAVAGAAAAGAPAAEASSDSGDTPAVQVVVGQSNAARKRDNKSTTATAARSKEHAPGRRGDANREAAARSRPKEITIETTSKRGALSTVFAKDSREELDARRARAQHPFSRLPAREALTLTEEQLRVQNLIDMPRRPAWAVGMSRSRIEQNEERAFKAWISDIYTRFDRAELNYFEHNLDVWRQLWRVLEISDVLFLVVDARHPVFHFPPSLYNFISEELGKPMVLVMNKVDLVHPNTVLGWIRYFRRRYPHLAIVPFSCFPKDAPAKQSDYRTDEAGRVIFRKRKKRVLKRKQAVGILELLRACGSLRLARPIAGLDWDAVLASIAERLAVQATDPLAGVCADTEGALDDVSESESDSASASDGGAECDVEPDAAADEAAADASATASGSAPGRTFLTIGMVGHPNVGKSALINALMNKHVVSVRRTPGHTKHLQTIFLTDSVCLCDCPGLIFPRVAMPKALQVLCGLFPTSQVSEPFSCIQYLAERMPVEELLGLALPAEVEARLAALGPRRAVGRGGREGDEDDSADDVGESGGKATSAQNPRQIAQALAAQQRASYAERHKDLLGVGGVALVAEPATVALHTAPDGPWTAWAIAEAYALRRGFMTAKGRPDVYRAAILLLYDVFDGFVICSFLPPEEFQVANDTVLDADEVGIMQRAVRAYFVAGAADADASDEASDDANGDNDNDENDRADGSQRGAANRFDVLARLAAGEA